MLSHHPDDELLSSGQVRRRRSPLFGPLVLLFVAAIGVAGYRTIAPLLSSDADPLDDFSDPDESWACLEPTERDRRLSLLDRRRESLTMTMARAEWVVEGSITDGVVDDNLAVAVHDVVVVRGRIPGGLDRLALPLSAVPTDAPWQGARFVAFVSEVDRVGGGTVVPGGFFFSCGSSDQAASLGVMAEEDAAGVNDLASIKRSFGQFAPFADSHLTLNVAPRVHALEVRSQDHARVAVFLPERLAGRFEVWQLEQSEPWPVIFSNNTVVGRIGIGPCEDRPAERCSGNLRMDIESLSGVEVPGALIFLGGPSSGTTQQAFGQVVMAELEAPQTIAEGELVLYQSQGALFAVDAESLEPRWSHGGGEGSTLEWFGGTPDRIVVRSRLTEALTGLRADGSVAWRYRTDGTVLPALGSPSPILIQSWVYTGADSRERVLVALNPDSGQKLWEFRAQVPALGASSTEDRSAQGLFVVELIKEEPLAARRDFIGLEVATGEIRWRVLDRPGGSVAEIGGFVWWAGPGGLARIDGDTGSSIWQVDRGAIGDLSVNGNVVDLGSAGSFDLESGQRLRDPSVSPCC